MTRRNNRVNRHSQTKTALNLSEQAFGLGHVAWGAAGAHDASVAFDAIKSTVGRIEDFRPAKARECLRRVYRDAVKVQGDREDFGGLYHELTIGPGGFEWYFGPPDQKN